MEKSITAITKICTAICNCTDDCFYVANPHIIHHKEN